MIELQAEVGHKQSSRTYEERRAPAREGKGIAAFVSWLHLGYAPAEMPVSYMNTEKRRTVDARVLPPVTRRRSEAGD